MAKKSLKTKKTGQAPKANKVKKGRLGKRKKTSQGPIGPARFYIQSTFNNTMVTATDEAGNTLAWATAGSVGFRGTKKSTPFAAQTAMKKVLEKLPLEQISSAKVLVKGVGSGRDAAARVLSGKGIPVTQIKDRTPLPHNGSRPKKPRKV